MDIKAFASTYKVRTKQDGCGDPIIPGKQFATDMPDRLEYRSHVFDYQDGQHFALCLMFAPSGHSGKSAKWTYAKQKLIAAGFAVRQDGEAEGIALFDPTDKVQARLAVRLAGIKTRRPLSPEKAVALATRLQAARAAKLNQRLNQNPLAL